MKRDAWRGAVAIVFAVGALAACEAPTLPAAEEDPLADLEPGIHPVVAVTARQGTGASVELRLHRVEVLSRIASYQGELRFDPDRLALQEVSFPEGVLGAWWEVKPGRLRLAGARLEGLPEGAVLVLRVQERKQGVLDARAFRFEVEELRAAGDFRDLLPLLAERSRPIFSAAPLD